MNGSLHVFGYAQTWFHPHRTRQLLWAPSVLTWAIDLNNVESSWSGVVLVGLW